VSAYSDSCFCVHKTVGSLSVTFHLSENFQKYKNCNNKSNKKKFQQWWFRTVVCETGDFSGLQEYRFIKSWKLVLRDRNRRTNPTVLC